MVCYNELLIKDLQKNIVQVPCGQCVGCRLERARQWAVRCVHESQMYDQNCFVTLTYNKDHLPPGGSLKKRDFQLFMKRLRRRFDREVRFYACGEYGSGPGSRPHYHACLFNLDFDDKYLFRTGSRWRTNHLAKGSDLDLYRSPLLEEIWPLGFTTVGTLTFESAGYVARYCMKKITGEHAQQHYDGKVPEFALMSRGNSEDGKGGIGKPWLEKYWTDVYPKDYFTINGKKNRPPRYYDMLLEKKNPKLYKELKKKRVEELLKNKDDILRVKMKERHKTLTVKQLQRSLENENGS